LGTGNSVATVSGGCHKFLESEIRETNIRDEVRPLKNGFAARNSFFGGYAKFSMWIWKRFSGQDPIWRRRPSERSGSI
jgi:hypothetical protein